VVVGSSGVKRGSKFLRKEDRPSFIGAEENIKVRA